MVKGSFILSIDVDDDTLYVREENGGYRALLKPSRKMHKVFPLSSLCKEYNFKRCAEWQLCRLSSSCKCKKQ